MNNAKASVNVNGTEYRWPLRPVVVVCIDGGDPRYLQQFLADGSIPNIARCVTQGHAAVAEGSMPSFTCPNNMSIITGTPTAKHGISGNFYLDTATWQPVVMTGPELLRGDTIIARFAAAGAKVVTITAKDKLRKQLGKGLDVAQGHVCFSSEFAEPDARWPKTASRTCSPGWAWRSRACIRWSCPAGAGSRHQAAARAPARECCTCR